MIFLDNFNALFSDPDPHNQRPPGSAWSDADPDPNAGREKLRNLTGTATTYKSEKKI